MAVLLTKVLSEAVRPNGFIRIAAALLLPASAVVAGTFSQVPRVGDTYQITLVKDSVQKGSNGSSGTTHDEDTIIERVTGLRADGPELQYDLANTATAEERTRDWQFPAEVFKPFAGPAQLLNGSEMETRIESWLKELKGEWLYTNSSIDQFG